MTSEPVRPREDVPDDADRIDPAIWKIMCVVMLGSFLAQLDSTIVNVSLSNLAVELHSDLANIQWVISGYLLALTLVLPLNAWLVNRIGGKRLYLWCFSSFTLSSALCGLAWSANSLIFFRVLQGVSGGLLAPMTQMMMARAAGRHMARMLGYAVVPVLLAPVFGPIVAGAILQYSTWRWLFLVNVPVGVVGILLAAVFLPDDREYIRPRALDWGGLALLSPGLALFLYGCHRVDATEGRLVLAASLALLAAFFRLARRKQDRALIELRLFTIRVFATASITMFLNNGVIFAGQMLIPVFLIGGFGRSPAEMGWMLAPMGVGMLGVYPLMGALTKHFGVRRVVATGSFASVLSTLPFIYMTIYGFDTILLTAALIVRGAAQGCVGIPSMSAAYAAVKRPDLPMASTSLNIVQRLGGPTLTTVCATYLAWRLAQPGLPTGDLAPYRAAFILLAALHAACCLAALRLPLWANKPEGHRPN
jgi:EmrB/QacA subfamily drug resistance transporter